MRHMKAGYLIGRKDWIFVHETKPLTGCVEGANRALKLRDNDQNDDIKKKNICYNRVYEIFKLIIKNTLTVGTKTTYLLTSTAIG